MTRILRNITWNCVKILQNHINIGQILRMAQNYFRHLILNDQFVLLKISKKDLLKKVIKRECQGFHLIVSCFMFFINKRTNLKFLSFYLHVYRCATRWRRKIVACKWQSGIALAYNCEYLLPKITKEWFRITFPSLNYWYYNSLFFLSGWHLFLSCDIYRGYKRRKNSKKRNAINTKICKTNTKKISQFSRSDKVHNFILWKWLSDTKNHYYKNKKRRGKRRFLSLRKVSTLLT